MQGQGNTILHYSAEFGHVEITEMLIEKHGMDPAIKSTVCNDVIYIPYVIVKSLPPVLYGK